jgi:hypothetical protein
MMAIFLASAIPAFPALVGFIFGVVKDGSPLRKEWWS